MLKIFNPQKEMWQTIGHCKCPTSTPQDYVYGQCQWHRCQCGLQCPTNHASHGSPAQGPIHIKHADADNKTLSLKRPSFSQTSPIRTMFILIYLLYTCSILTWTFVYICIALASAFWSKQSLLFICNFSFGELPSSYVTSRAPSISRFIHWFY